MLPRLTLLPLASTIYSGSEKRVEATAMQKGKGGPHWIQRMHHGQKSNRLSNKEFVDSYDLDELKDLDGHNGSNDTKTEKTQRITSSSITTSARSNNIAPVGPYIAQEEQQLARPSSQ